MTAPSAGPQAHTVGIDEAEASGMLGPTVPARLLRLLLAAASSGLVAVVTASAAPSSLALALLVALATATVVLATTHLPTVFLAISMWLVVRHDDGVTAWLALLALAAHATHVLASLVAVVPWGTTVERAAVRPTLLRFLVVQAATQPLILLTWLITPT